MDWSDVNAGSILAAVTSSIAYDGGNDASDGWRHIFSAKQRKAQTSNLDRTTAAPPHMQAAGAQNIASR